jgi:hypothetical protein
MTETSKQSSDAPINSHSAASTVSSFAAFIADMGKIITMLGVIAYATGALAINVSLSRWGASDLNLLRARPIVVGAWFYVFYFFSGAPAAFIFSKARVWFEVRPLRNRRKIVALTLSNLIKAVMLFVLWLLCPLGVICLMASVDPSWPADLGSYKHAYPAFILLTGFSAISVYFVALCVKESRTIIGRPQRGSYYLGIGVGLVFFVFLVLEFSAGMYMVIPAERGGGLYRPEQIVFTKDIDPTVLSILQKPDVGKTVLCGDAMPDMNPVSIVYSGDSFLLLQTCDGKQVVRLDRKYVAAEFWSESPHNSFAR